jgi:hypothetical protein
MRVNRFHVGAAGLLLLGALALQQNACSLALSFDPDGLKCDPERKEVPPAGSGVFHTNFCLQGYSCLNSVCVRDRSHDEGEPCSQPIQCQEGQACPIDLLDRTCRGEGGCKSCLKPCSAVVGGDPYYQDQACEAGSYCGAFKNGLFDDPNSSPLPACAPGDGCQAGQACTFNGDTGGVCVPISATANACMNRCELNWDGVKYKDNCGTGRGCAVVGKPGSKQFVCFRSGDTPEGQACSLVSRPCANGYVCVGTCRQYCQVGTAGATCPATQVCCSFKDMDPGLSPLNGYCAPQGTCP